MDSGPDPATTREGEGLLRRPPVGLETGGRAVRSRLDRRPEPENLRLNPNDGTLTATDATLAYAAGDPNFGANPNEVALAYSNNVAGALSTTLYGIDSGLDVLVMQGGPAASRARTAVS